MINKEEEFDDDSKLINDIQELRDYISNIKDGEFPDDFDSFFNSNLSIISHPYALVECGEEVKV